MVSHTSSGRTTSTGRQILLAAVAATLAGTAGPALAASGTWTGSGTTGDPVVVDPSWSNPGNWTVDPAPGATGTTNNTDTATFTAATNLAVTVDANRNVQNLTFNGANAADTFTLTGGSLVLTSGGTISTTGRTQTINSPITIAGETATYTFSSTVPSSNGRQLVINGSVAGASTGTNVTTLTLTGTNGGTTAQGVFGVISDGTGGGKLALVKDGINTMSVNGALATPNTYTGGTTVNAGTLRMASAGNSSAGFGSGTIKLNGGTLFLGSSTANTFNNPLDVPTTGTITFRSNSNFTPSSMTGTGTLTLAVGPGGNAGLVGTSTNFLDYGGVINSTLGTLRLGTGYVGTSLQNARLNNGATSFLSTQFGTNATVTITIGALSGGGVVGGSGVVGGGTIVYSIGNRAEDTVFSGAIVNGSTKTGLTKTGNNSLTLTGGTATVNAVNILSNYTGATTVTGGKLVSGATNAFGASAVGVTGGTLKIGDGTVNTVGGLAGLTMATGTTLELGGADSAVTLASGNFSLGDITLDLNNLFNAPGTYTLINAAAGSTNAIGTVSFADVDTSDPSKTFSFAVAGNGNGVLTVAVPEPTSLAALGFAGAAMAARRRRN